MRTLCVFAYRYEAELAYRWRRLGLSIRYISEALIDHLPSSACGTEVGPAPQQQLAMITCWFVLFFRLRTAAICPACLAGMFT